MLTLNRKLKRLFIATVIVLTLWEFVAWSLARLLVVSAELPQASAIVVLSGSSDYVERSQLAATLFKEQKAPLIVLTNDGQRSGWSNTQQRNPYFVERAKDELLSNGVPPERIEIISEAVNGTNEEALLLRRYASERHFPSLLVVTSPYHSRRAFWILRQRFRGIGTQIGLATLPLEKIKPRPATWWLSMFGWKVVAGEYLKYLYYYGRYRD